MLALGVFFGIVSDDWHLVELNGAPLELVRNTIPTATIVFSFLVAWIPIIFIGILGISLIAKNMVTKPSFNWSLLGIWIIGIIGAGTTIPIFFTNYNVEGTQKRNFIYDMPEGRPMKIQLNETQGLGFENVCLNEVRLHITGHDKPHAELFQALRAKGSSRRAALENARLIEYVVEHSEEGDLIFDETYNLARNAPFRDQELEMELRIPFDKKFEMSHDLVKIIRRGALEGLYDAGYTFDDLGENIWIYEEEGGLKCLTCTGDGNSKFKIDVHGNAQKTLDLDADLNELKIDGNYQVVIKKGEHNHAYVFGPEWEVSQTVLPVNNGKLYLKRNDHEPYESRKVKIVLHLKDLEEVRARGGGKLRIVNWENDDLSLNLREGVACEVEGMIDDVSVIVRDRASIKLSGLGESLSVAARDAASVNAFDFKVEEVNAIARDGSFVKVFGTKSTNATSKDGARIITREEGEKLHLKKEDKHIRVEVKVD